MGGRGERDGEEEVKAVLREISLRFVYVFALFCVMFAFASFSSEIKNCWPLFLFFNVGLLNPVSNEQKSNRL